MPDTSTLDQKLTRAEKEKVALELRLTGISYDAIAEEMGYSRRYVHKLILAALARIPKEAATQVIQMELDRMDKMFGKAYARATALGTKDDIQSCLRIMTRRAKLLGLDATPGDNTGDFNESDEFL